MNARVLINDNDWNEPIKVGRIRRVGAERGFSAPAYRLADVTIGERWGDDCTGEVPAAHGGIAYTEEELLNGRRRTVVQNGDRIEIGPWGPTRESRARWAAKLRHAIHRPPPVTVTAPDGRDVSVRLDRECMIIVTPGTSAVMAALATLLPAEWVEQAQSARRAYLLAARAKADI